MFVVYIKKKGLAGCLFYDIFSTQDSIIII
jgi:hypothetical protein